MINIRKWNGVVAALAALGFTSFTAQAAITQSPTLPAKVSIAAY